MADSTRKVCAKCAETKPLEAFSKSRAARDGLQGTCRECAKMWREQNRERVRETARKWKAANPAADRRYKKTYREKHPEAAREYRQANRRARTEYQAKWRAENPELARDAMRRHARTAYEKDSSKAVERANRRRALILERRVGPVDLQRLWDVQGDRCPLCGEDIDRTLKWPDPMCASLDHIVPLALGGTHEQSNLQWAHLVCNIRKGAKAP